MRHAIFLGGCVMLFCCAHASAAAPATVPIRTPSTHRTATPAPSPPPRLDPALLYSRRSRRLVQSYLRLKLGEVREADLDRARLVIEHKLGIWTLLGETPPPASTYPAFAPH